MSAVESFTNQSPDQPAVHGFLHRPDGQASGALVLTHGAGSNCGTPLLVAMAEAFAAGGLLLLSYPLHPPDKPEQLRTAHFPKLQTPALFVHGCRDPFGSLEELQSARALIQAPTELLHVEGAGHDLGRRGYDALAQRVLAAFVKLVNQP